MYLEREIGFKDMSEEVLRAAVTSTARAIFGLMRIPMRSLPLRWERVCRALHENKRAAVMEGP